MKTFGILLVALALDVSAQAPDNTKTNQRDKNAATMTADKQGDSKADIDRTKLIRKAITDQKNLSTYAKNVKVVTLDQKVTLRGPVRDQAERDMIGKLATGIAGLDNVRNELEIAPAKTGN